MTEPATILVVDDQAPNRKLLADLLSVRGFRVVTADSGTAGLDAIAREIPDLVLLDVLMPDRSGYDVCRAIRANAQTGVLPVVMVTALDQTEERVKGLEAGADDFLSKPINTTELLARVNSLLRVKTYHDMVQRQAAELAELNAGLELRVQEQLSELQRLAQLKRFFPPHLAERIVSGDVDDPLATHRREVTVAILDLRGFTAFADTSEPEEVMSLLRRYHQEMGQIIQSHGGTLEQFSGSSMLVVFNDPVVVVDPGERAVRMALAARQRFDELIAEWRRRGHELSLGIGIAHGYATIGAIGHEGRIAYGVIGRVTNLASRLSLEARPGEILAGASVLADLEDRVEAAPADHVNLGDFVRPGKAFSILRLRAREAAVDEDVPPVRIFALGQFALLKNGQPVAFSRKVQKRPLDLLKILIAHGGTRADTGPIIGALWPDAEGDAAKVSFDSNLHRLRKLLEVDDAVKLAEGRLSLSADKCWVDVWAFEKVVSEIDAAIHGGSDAVRGDLAALASDLLRHYTGHFIDSESGEPWAVAARDRLKSKFLRSVTMLGAALEQSGQWEQSTALYARALELDNLAEGMYRRLMICYRELGETAEALNVYRRCREMLSIVLGTRPSAETEAVRATLDR